MCSNDKFLFDYISFYFLLTASEQIKPVVTSAASFRIRKSHFGLSFQSTYTAQYLRSSQIIDNIVNFKGVLSSGPFRNTSDLRVSLFSDRLNKHRALRFTASRNTHNYSTIQY